VATTHIKKHRFFSHRSQCRPRLESMIQPILPLDSFPSTPERSSSVSSIHAQASCHSDLEQTTTTAIVKLTSQVQLTSTRMVVTSLSTSLTHSASASTTTTAIVKHNSTVQATSATTSFSTPIIHSASASTTTIAIVKDTSTVQLTSMTKVATSLSNSLTPNGVKAGIAGGDAYPYMKDHIGWWYDWSVSVPFFPLA
jgi:hypothetical protein